MSRYHRTTREAFPVERFPAMFGPYSRPTFLRQAARVAVWLAAFATIGAVIGMRF